MVDESIVEEIREKAHEYDQHSGCSQSVLLALQEGLDIGCEDSFRSATVLSGGVARRGETCGALLGGLMALGMVCGRSRIEDTQSYFSAVAVADEICNEFQKRMEEEFGFTEPLESTLCAEIQTRIYGRSFDIRDPEERDAFLAAGGHSDEGCYKTCGIGAQVAAERLLRIIEESG